MISRMVRYVMVALILSVKVTPLHATPPFMTNKHTKEIIINATEVTCFAEENRCVATGNAQVQQGDATINADVITIHDRLTQHGKKELWKFTADHNVKISTTNETALADHAAYDIDADTIILTGTIPTIHTPTATISAKENIRYHRAQGLAIAAGEAQLVTDQRTLLAQEIRAFIVSDQDEKVALDHAEAFGGVTLLSKEDIATGAYALYDAKSGQATLAQTSPSLQGAQHPSQRVRVVINPSTRSSFSTTSKQS